MASDANQVMHHPMPSLSMRNAGWRPCRLHVHRIRNCAQVQVQAVACRVFKFANSQRGYISDANQGRFSSRGENLLCLQSFPGLRRHSLGYYSYFPPDNCNVKQLLTHLFSVKTYDETACSLDTAVYATNLDMHVNKTRKSSSELVCGSACLSPLVVSC